MIFVTSMVIWLLETVKYWFIMQAFPFEVSFFALMLMNGVVNLATTLPSAPGYVGTFHYVCQMTLAYFGVPASSALSYATLVHAINFVPVLLVGMVFSYYEGVNKSTISEKGLINERISKI